MTRALLPAVPSQLLNHHLRLTINRLRFMLSSVPYSASESGLTHANTLAMAIHLIYERFTAALRISTTPGIFTFTATASGNQNGFLRFTVH